MRHKLTNIDEINKTATCNICGSCKITIRNKDSVTKSKWRCLFSTLVRKRVKNITLEELLQIKDIKDCQICGSTEKLHIDHCHETGRIRGILCSFCNLGLGQFKDNINSLKNAVKYLNKKNPQDFS